MRGDTAAKHRKNGVGERERKRERERERERQKILKNTRDRYGIGIRRRPGR